MPQILRTKFPVLAVITDKATYVEARKAADKLAAEYGLRVADMPMVIQAMTQHPGVDEAIKPKWIDTITGEYHGQRYGDRSYEVWHSAGSLATAEGLEKAVPKAREYALAFSVVYAFMPIADDEWVAVGKGNYNGQNIERVHLDDLRKGNVPVAGTPYTVFVRLDKDNPKINNQGLLKYDAFMQDDRVLMITGSPENRESLAKIRFGRKGKGGEDWDLLGSHHKIHQVGFDAKAKGRLVYLCGNILGIAGDNYLDYAHFIAVGNGGAVHDKSAYESVVQPTLEQILAVINNPDLNREDMVKAIAQLCKI